MRTMNWNRMRVFYWKWIRVSVIEVVDKKNGMAFIENEWIENMDANEKEKQSCVVMKVMEVK